MKIAINGFGRIGRAIVRAALQIKGFDNGMFNICAINDLACVDNSAHLLKYDSIYGVLEHPITSDSNHLIVNKHPICYFREKDPAQLPWAELNIDVVLECTGFFSDRASAEKHLHAGARRVLISQPATNPDNTIVFGVNHKTLQSSDLIISNASCTTNCLAPLAQIIHQNFEVSAGLINTVHSYTNDQRLLDGDHDDLMRARSAGLSLIPTKTGAAKAIGDVIPELSGKLDGLAVRVPTPSVSLLDFTFSTVKDFELKHLNECLKESAKGELRDILCVNEGPLVSSDFKGSPFSCIYDQSLSRKVDNFTKVIAWYDNECGFAHRMLDVSAFIYKTF